MNKTKSKNKSDRQIIVTWETICGIDWAKKLRITFNAMYSDMDTQIVTDAWYTEKAVFKTSDSLREIKLKFLETFLSIEGYKFRNLVVKEVSNND